MIGDTATARAFEERIKAERVRLGDRPPYAIQARIAVAERRYDDASTVFCTQYAKKDWHQRLGSGVHADAIMDRIVHNTIWIETGSTNMREHAAVTAA